MKRRSTQGEKKRATSPYARHDKKEYDYSSMYRRILTQEPTSGFAKHLRERRKMDV